MTGGLMACLTFILEPEKYVAARSPARVRSSATASASRALMIAWVRVSCHTSALCSGRPVTASHATVVSRWFVMAMILFGYLILGCLMDQIAILILTVPIVLPLVKALGFDPIWFGVIVIVTAEVGMVTPPVGLNVFVVSRYTGRPLGEIFQGVMPHVIAHILVIALFVVFPEIILWLPSTMK